MPTSNEMLPGATVVTVKCAVIARDTLPSLDRKHETFFLMKEHASFTCFLIVFGQQ